MFSRAAAVLACLALTIACGGSSRTDQIVWWTPSWGESRARELVSRFEAAHPGRSVRLEITVADGLPTRIQTALRSGSPPDLIEAQHGWVVPYAQANLLQPVSAVLTAREDYVPEALDYVTWNGELWAIPFRIEAHAIIFNRQMFRAAGLDPDNPPRTWTELATAATRLTRKRDDGRNQYGFAITGGGEVGNTLFRSLPFVWMNGGNLLSPDMKSALIDRAPAVEALTFYTDMFTRLRVSPSSTLQDDGLAARRLFIAESVAMYQSGPFDLGPIRQENPAIDVGVMMIPHPEGKSTAAVLGGWSFVVPKDAANAEGARELLAFLTESGNMGFFTDTFPARRSALELPRFSDPLLENFKNMLPHARRIPQHRNWLQIVQIYFEHVQRILLGEAAPGRAMADAAREIQALLQ